MAYPLHVRILRFCLLLVLASLALVIPSVAQRTKPIFEQDLQSYGYKFQYARDDRMQSFTDLAFLSDDLVLVSVKELYLDELHPKILPSGTIMYDNPMGARTPPTSLSTLLLFSLDQKKLVRSAKLPIRKMDGAVQATQNGHFLMLSSYGLHLCSAQLECGPPWPTEGPVYISPQGIRAVVGGSRWSEQQLVDVDKFAVRETFKSGPPTVIPGDVGLMLVGYQNTLVRMPGRKDLDVGFGGDVVSPRSRFLDHDKVIGIKMSGISEGKATATKVDGTVLYQIEVKDAWRHNVQLVSSASGLSFCVAELYYTRLNSMINFFDIGDNRDYNRARIRVFEVSTGKQMLELNWDPREYRGEDTLPAISPSGHRLAVVRKGKLQVYAVP